MLPRQVFPRRLVDYRLLHLHRALETQVDNGAIDDFQMVDRMVDRAKLRILAWSVVQITTVSLYMSSAMIL